LLLIGWSVFFGTSGTDFTLLHFHVPDGQTPTPLRPPGFFHIMRSTLRFVLALSFALVGTAGARAEKQLYTCSMHPEIIRDEPGDCPICGMKLQPVRAKETPQAGDSSSQRGIRVDAGTIQRMNLRTALVEHGPVRREFRAVGIIAYDQSSLHEVTTEYEGWIEKLYVTATGTPVKAGDPLFEVYSPALYPDLHNTQLTYLVPSDFATGNTSTKEGRRALLFRAPVNGTVIEKTAVEGQRIREGECVFRLADLSTLWVEAQIYESDVPFVHEGQPAVVRATYGPERTIEGTVQRLLPHVDPLTRTVAARIVLPNSDGSLRPGMFVEVRFAAQLADDAVLVPEMAVLRSGERNTVFLALPGGCFEPREVKLGVRSQGGFYQVLDGLRAGERIVTSGQFMLDSESQLRESFQKMQTPPAK
jgi:multidrug efflux pump subunit AcrA (membrane-fusion protein)